MISPSEFLPALSGTVDPESIGRHLVHLSKIYAADTWQWEGEGGHSDERMCTSLQACFVSSYS